ncbi:MAG: nucleoside deaminase [Chloroflexota bacterium]
MWETLNEPWQAALEMAWEAYRAGTIPIGAVVADFDGKVVARGRNRIHDTSAPHGQVWGHMLAHAEVNALFDLQLDQESRHSAVLYTTMEPCPLCMGAFYMSSVRTLHFAARDPWAGSTNLLGTTPYLSRKPIRVVPPFDPSLEIALIAMWVDIEIRRRVNPLPGKFFLDWREMLPQAIDMGIEFSRSNELWERRESSAPQVFNWLINQVQ